MQTQEINKVAGSFDTYIQDNAQHTLSYKELSDSANTGEIRFSKRFKQQNHTGLIFKISMFALQFAALAFLVIVVISYREALFPVGIQKAASDPVVKQTATEVQISEADNGINANLKELEGGFINADKELQSLLDL